MRMSKENWQPCSNRLTSMLYSLYTTVHSKVHFPNKKKTFFSQNTVIAKAPSGILLQTYIFDIYTKPTHFTTSINLLKNCVHGGKEVCELPVQQSLFFITFGPIDKFLFPHSVQKKTK